MKKSLIILLFFAFLTIVFTYPLILKLDSAISGFDSTLEPYGNLWNFWRINHSWHNDFSLSFTDLIAYPFGVSFKHNFPRVYFWDAMTFLFGISLNHFAAYNTQILINFVLSGFFMYLLVFSLTKNNPASIFSGLIFTFCPQHFFRSWEHIGLSYFQWMPLYLFALFNLRNRTNLKNYILSTLALLAVASFDTHYFYYMIIATAVLFIVESFHMLRIKKKIKESKAFLKYLILTVITVVVLTIPQYWLYIRNIFSSSVSPSSHNPFQRPFDDLFYQSSKPLGYLLPSVEHPIFGRFTEFFVGDFLFGHSFVEHTLYLGWTTIILSFIAFRLWKKRQKIEVETTDSEKRENFAIGYFLLLAIVAWFFSQPPWWKIGSFRIFMPSFLMYKVLPMVRANCRFGILVLFASSVLAGFGLKSILDKIRTNSKKTVVAVCFCGLILFEFFHIPSEHVIDLSATPVVYEWLKAQRGDFVIAEYPLDTEGQVVSYLFNQTKHQKKMINGTFPGTTANDISRLITKLSGPKTAGILKWLDVKYVVVHKEKYEKSGLIESKEELRRIKRNRKLKFVISFGNVDVYEVIAKPIDPSTILEKGGLR